MSSAANCENMNFVYTLAKLLKVSDKSFIKSLNSFVGLPHRYEVFLKKKNITFVNDSKATSFQATKFALTSSKNIFWILGGLPKDKDKIETFTENYNKFLHLRNHAANRKIVCGDLDWSIKNDMASFFEQIIHLTWRNILVVKREPLLVFAQIL